MSNQHQNDEIIFFLYRQISIYFNVENKKKAKKQNKMFCRHKSVERIIMNVKYA